MPTFTDLHILAELAGTRSKGNFEEFMERETGYTWDGTPEGKVSLIAKLWESHFHENRDKTDTRIEKLESDLLPILAEMEYTGVRLDQQKLRNIRTRIVKEKELKEKEIFEVTGEFFNINSPKQVAEILFGKLALKWGKKNKTGYSVDSEVLEEISKEYPIARLILDYRSLSKLQSTYGDGLLGAVHPHTGRIHTTYNQIGAATGRMSSIDPNLQNIPSGDGYAREIKSCFVTDASFFGFQDGEVSESVFLVADYSQVELRVLAWLSWDEHLLDAFEKGEDIHARTAKFLFRPTTPLLGEENAQGRHSDSVYKEENLWKPTSEQRRIAKTVNFGVIYGITWFWLSKTLGTSPLEADEYIRAFYEKYPRVRAYYDDILEKGREVGYVETVFGRRRYIPGLRDANKTLRSIAEREAINMPIQWTAADMIKYAMIDIHMRMCQEKFRGKMLLQVHDELVFEVPKTEEKHFSEMVRDCMEQVLIRNPTDTVSSVSRLPPIRVDIHTWSNWAEAKG